MSLPGINISFSNGALNSSVPSPDGVFGVIASAVAVGSTFLLNKAYQIKSMQDVAALGITNAIGTNYRLYKFLKEFYDEAGGGSEIWIMGRVNTETITFWFTPDGTTGISPYEVFQTQAGRKLRGVFTVLSASAAPAVTNGLATDVYNAIPAAQSILNSYMTAQKAPAFVIIEGHSFSGDKTALTDLLTMTNNRVGVCIGDTEKASLQSAGAKGAATGLLAGRLAKYSVAENVGKVRNGALTPTVIYIGASDVLAENYDVGAVHDKGFITFRVHPNRSGYYFSDDPLASLVSDDYHYITRRRTIDKAYRIGYDALLDFLLDDTTLNPNGTISGIYAKTIEGRVQAAIYNQMTANGELSQDPTNPNDRGVIFKLDTTYNSASTSTLKVAAFQVRTKGVNRWIDVPLGFVPITTN